MALPETRHTSEANQRAPPEHVMSAAVMYATQAHDSPWQPNICHSVQVWSDPKAKYNSQRYHDLLKGICYTIPPPQHERALNKEQMH